MGIVVNFLSTLFCLHSLVVLNIFGHVSLVYLSEEERILVVDGVESVGRNQTRPEFFPDRVGGQTVHVYFDVGADFLVRQELTGDDLIIKPKQSKKIAENSCSYTCTEHWAAITPSTEVSAKGSKLRSTRRMNSGLSR